MTEYKRLRTEKCNAHQMAPGRLVTDFRLVGTFRWIAGFGSLVFSGVRITGQELQGVLAEHRSTTTQL